MKKILLITLFVLLSISSVLAATQITSRVSSSNDDAEERISSSGSMYLTSSDLELVNDGSRTQIVGMRFNNIDMPQGVQIVNAYIQFTVDETKGSGASAVLNFNAEAADNAQGFSSTAYDISSRALTNATVQWDVPAWNTVGEDGLDQQTPDLSAVIQEVINRPGWTSLNSIVVIVQGSGTRTAEAYNGSSGQAPLLVIDYYAGPPVYQCSDGLDNDGDYLIDHPDDPGCAGANDDNEWGSNECDDGVDNDGDSFTDLADSGCSDVNDTDESNCGDGVCEGEETSQSCSTDCPAPQCNDGTDNDGDGLIDLLDPGCTDANDDNETDYPAGAWKFAVLGDTRSGHDAHSENIIGIVNKIPNSERVTVLNTGDINADGEIAQWETWTNINALLEIDTTKKDPPDYIGAVGNHDTHVSDWINNWTNYLPAQCGLTAYPAIAGDINGRYGSVKHDNTVFIWVDSDTTPAGQETFLEDTLISAFQDPEVKWKFVFFHHPPIPCGSKSDWGTGKTWHDNYFVPYGVDIVFLGHAHYYERTCPFTSASAKTCDEDNRGNVIGDSDGVIHVITGGGGAGTYSTGSCAWLDSAAESHHFLEMEINGDILNLKTWNTDVGGANPALMDDFTIDKTPINPVYQCSDGIDNDGDNLTDYPNDPGCLSETDNNELGSNQCDDGLDNDGDGFADLADSGCSDVNDTDESNCGDGVCEGEETSQSCLTDCPAPQCNDGTDNDGDGLIDLSDPGCADVSDDDEHGSNECDDGVDNDGDGFIDLADSGCADAFGSDESDCGDSVCEGLETWPECSDCPAPQCNDGTDNDGDGLIDLSDPGCADVSDDDEHGSNECDDGVDNDGDGFIDVLDGGCADAFGIDESNCGDSVCEGLETWPECSDCPAVPQCSDGQDNDGDNLIDFPADPGCTAADDNDEYNPLSTTEISSRVSSSTDDAEEQSSGSMSLTSSDLELVDNQIVGMRFNNIDIPQGAQIVNAYIQFTVDETKGSGASAVLNFNAEAIDSAQGFTSTINDITNRDSTNASVQWDVLPWNTVGESGLEQQTPDLSAVIQEVINRPGWTNLNSIVVIVTGTGTRTAESYNGASAQAPLLVIEYYAGPPVYQCSDSVDNDGDGLIDSPADPGCTDETDDDELGSNQCDDGVDNDGDGLTDLADSGCSDVYGDKESICGNSVCEPGESWQDCPGDCTVTQCNDGLDNDGDTLIDLADPGCTDENDNDEFNPVSTTEISSRVSSSTDDAEERISNGRMRLTSSDLELVKDGSRTQLVGMRFNNIDIPQGAQIASAYIQFTVDETKGSGASAVVVFYAQAADNAQGFSSTAYDISNRSLTNASVEWSVPAWNTAGAAGLEQQTPDLSAVIQEVINRPGWINLNSVVVIVTGSGTRTAESFNGQQQSAPLLVIEY